MSGIAPLLAAGITGCTGCTGGAGGKVLCLGAALANTAALGWLHIQELGPAALKRLALGLTASQCPAGAPGAAL